MAIYFASSDENGNYSPKPSQRFLRAHPFYTRATVIMNGAEWKTLRSRCLELRNDLGVPEEVEIKWSYIWSIYKHQKNNQQVTPNKPYYSLSKLPYSRLLGFVDECLSLLQELKSAKVIITVTENNTLRTMSEEWHLRMHIQEHMQRIEMELQGDPDNLGILFVDSISPQKDKLVRDVYHGIFQSGDFIEKYHHIKDSINFEYSHHSVGVQIADFVSGCFSGTMRGFTISCYIFHQRIFPFLRCSTSGEIMGYGIREVPRDTGLRNRVDKALDKAVLVGTQTTVKEIPRKSAVMKVSSSL